ncbi:MAG: hypothetical protein ABIG84_07220 [archaeon]
MADTLTIAIVSFLFGAIFFELLKTYRKRPKGYIRIKHNDSDERDLSGKRVREQRRDSTSSVRSKFDYLFNYGGSKREPSKVDLESVEKSFQPDPKPAASFGSSELQNKYLDLSHIAVDREPRPETTPTQQSPYSSSSYSSPYSQSTPNYPPNNAPQNPQNIASSPYMQNTGYSPMSSVGQTQSAPLERPPIKKDEKEHEWKPMGFFDD